MASDNDNNFNITHVQTTTPYFVIRSTVFVNTATQTIYNMLLPNEHKNTPENDRKSGKALCVCMCVVVYSIPRGC